MKRSGLFLLICLLCLPFTGKAQEIMTEATDSILTLSADSIIKKAIAPDEDSSVSVVILEADSIGVPKVDMNPAFKPDPTRATLYAIIPGLGQIYNRKYWKLPLVYGGFMGFFYAVTWNNRNYQDYKQAYFDLFSTDQSVKDNWKDYVPVGFSESQAKDYLKSKKDYFRRYRDLSIILTVGFYAITVIDAYVDAELFDFDISPDLSMHVEPVYMPKTSFSSRSYGINCSVTF